jgi:predicted phage tail protein
MTTIFAVYAGSGIWKAVHVGQFMCAAILLAGLVVLSFAVNAQAGRARWVGRFGAASAGVALALYGVLQAVDGVGNKEVDDAWVNAPNGEKAARFASAQAMRWLEWGLGATTTSRWASLCS